RVDAVGDVVAARDPSDFAAWARGQQVAATHAGRFRGERPELDLQRRHDAFAVRVHAVGEEDVEGPRGRIDPESRAGEAGVAVRAEGEERAAGAAVAGVEVEAAGAADEDVRRRLYARHRLDSRALEDRRAAAEEHPRVLREVGGGG